MRALANSRDRGVPAGGIDHGARLDRVAPAVRIGGLDAAGTLPVEEDLRHAPSLAQVRAQRSGMTEEQIVEFVAGNLKGVGPARVERIGEREAGFTPQVVPELRAVLHHESFAHRVEQPEPVKDGHRLRQ